MQVYRSVVAVIVLFAAGALPVSAQDAHAVEVTPYVAVGSMGASPIGAAVTFPLTSRLGLEVDVAHRRGEGDRHLLSSSTSLLYAPIRIGATTPYVAAGVGLAQIGVPVF